VGGRRIFDQIAACFTFIFNEINEFTDWNGVLKSQFFRHFLGLSAYVFGCFLIDHA
jgi:hypothetical protein